MKKKCVIRNMKTKSNCGIIRCEIEEKANHRPDFCFQLFDYFITHTRTHTLKKKQTWMC